MSRLHRNRGHDSTSNDIFGAARRAAIKKEHDDTLKFRSGVLNIQLFINGSLASDISGRNCWLEIEYAL